MIFRFLGRLAFYVWVGLLALPVLVWAMLVSGLEVGLRRVRLPWHVALADRLIARDAVIWPALFGSLEDAFHQEDDGPGWSPEQLPRLWTTCRALAEKIGCLPPDAIHLSVEPGDCMAWQSKTDSAPLRRHICLSLLDLRLMSADEARAVIAHEITHAGFDHCKRSQQQLRTSIIIASTADRLGVLGLPLWGAAALYRLGLQWGSHDDEREADRRAAEAVGGNHAANALRISYVQGAVLQRVFDHVLAKALAGPRAPIRLAEAAVKVYRSYDFAKLKRMSWELSQLDGEQHPSLPARVAAAEEARTSPGVTRGATFIDAYPELLAAEELLTKTYFPDTPQHTRSDASQLRRKALAARLKRR